VKSAIVIFLVAAVAVTKCLADSGYADSRNSDAKSIRLLTPEVADFMKSADSVWVFRFDPNDKPSAFARETNGKEITGDEKNQLVAILSEPKSYYQGLYAIREPPPILAIEFRKGGEKLVVTGGYSIIGGSYQQRKLTGVLSDPAIVQFNQWEKKYQVEKL